MPGAAWSSSSTRPQVLTGPRSATTTAHPPRPDLGRSGRACAGLGIAPREVADCRSVAQRAVSLESGAVERTVPRAFGRIPCHDSVEVGAVARDGAAFVGVIDRHGDRTSAPTGDSSFNPHLLNPVARSTSRRKGGAAHGLARPGVGTDLAMKHRLAAWWLGLLMEFDDSRSPSTTTSDCGPPIRPCPEVHHSTVPNRRFESCE